MKRLVGLLLILCPVIASASGLYDIHPTRIQTPEDALVFIFPVLDQLRILTFRDLQLKPGYGDIKITKRPYIPGRNGRFQLFGQYSQYGGLQMFTEAQFAYMNSLDVDRWVFFPPTGWSVGLKPIAVGDINANAGSRVMLVLRTHFNI